MKYMVLILVLSQFTVHADAITASAKLSESFVAHVDTVAEKQAKAEAAAPLPKAELAAELDDDKTEATICLGNCSGPGTKVVVPTHAGLSPIPLDSISK